MVISIIGLLASVVFASLNSARAKARDARIISEFKEVQKALILYYDKYGRYPNETPDYTEPRWHGNFNSMAQQLVNEGFLGAVPRGPSPQSEYQYYNYGGPIGGLLVTSLEAAPDTTTGIPPSCRPWAPGLNWCSKSNSKEYCLCNPY